MSGSASSNFTSGRIVPSLSVWAAYQRFRFSEFRPIVKIQGHSKFVPTTNNDSTIYIETRNSNYGGFRWCHQTKTTDTNQFGTFKFQSFVNDGAGVNIFGYDGNQFSIYTTLNLNSNKIINLLPGTVGTDAVNMNQLWAISTGGTVTLTGEVTGSGSVGTPFATTIVSKLNQIPAPNAAVNFAGFKITSLATGTAGTDGVNVIQMNTAISTAVSAGTITLTGNVTGSGTVGSSFATTLVLRLNQILTPTGAMNMNTQNVGNVANLGLQSTASPTFPLQFSNTTADCKIALYPGAGNSFQVYGFGVLGSTLKYSVDNSASSHVFYCGASTTTSTELFRIHGSGYATVSGGDGTFYSRVPSIQISRGGTILNTSLTSSMVKLNITSSVVATGAVQFTSTGNRITFTGSDLGAACTGMVLASATLTATSLSNINLSVYKNGSIISPTSSWGSNTSTSIPISVSLNPAMTSLSPGDYLEIWGSSSPSTTVAAQDISLAFIAC